MIKLSVVIITFNEEKNIARCIDSVKEVADDIVVIDSFSKDRTKEICLSKGARFVEHVFEGHIQQKNWAVTQAQYPIVLSIDADEALDKKLTQSILKVKQNWNNPDRYRDGYYMNRLTNYCGHWVKHCGWYPDKKLRLWDSRKGEWRGINPHDKYEMFDGDKTTGYLEGDILHYSFDTINSHIKQIEYFTDISAKALFEKGKKPNFIKLYLSPAAKFIESYFLKAGFLDGKYGYEICKNSAWATKLKYWKLKKLYN
ncbi:MAG TPA: glycosyltransferase family 2 protein [Bacteroidia bacterium]|jgi:glycosyltransferase involved in cell wall biosynthesis|nr:glycosyltransferase family 2 protein [Bacteroidia bacterium]